MAYFSITLTPEEIGWDEEYWNYKLFQRSRNNIIRELKKTVEEWRSPAGVRNEDPRRTYGSIGDSTFKIDWEGDAIRVTNIIEDGPDADVYIPTMDGKRMVLGTTNGFGNQFKYLYEGNAGGGVIYAKQKSFLYYYVPRVGWMMTGTVSPIRSTIIQSFKDDIHEAIARGLRDGADEIQEEEELFWDSPVEDDSDIEMEVETETDPITKAFKLGEERVRKTMKGIKDSIVKYLGG